MAVIPRTRRHALVQRCPHVTKRVRWAKGADAQPGLRVVAGPWGLANEAVVLPLDLPS